MLNTTVLLKEKQVTVIPVSCTEQGRWSYTSERFADSGMVMEARMRRDHKASVNTSLRHTGRFASDQGQVWSNVADFATRAGVRSETGAMRDVFEHKREDIEGYVNALPVLAGQQGMVVFVGGDLMGGDFLSQPSAYGILHPKLIKSYAMEAITGMPRRSSGGKDYPGDARAFLESARSAVEEPHPSIGYGTDYRYEGKGMVGSALVHDDWVIHAAFFAADEKSAEVGPMSGFRQRRHFRD